MRLMSNDPRSKYCLSIKYLVSILFNVARFIFKFVTPAYGIDIYYHKNAVERKYHRWAYVQIKNCYLISHCKKSYSTEGVCQ